MKGSFGRLTCVAIPSVALGILSVSACSPNEAAKPTSINGVAVENASEIQTPVPEENPAAAYGDNKPEPDEGASGEETTHQDHAPGNDQNQPSSPVTSLDDQISAESQGQDTETASSDTPTQSLPADVEENSDPSPAEYPPLTLHLGSVMPTTLSLAKFTVEGSCPKSLLTSMNLTFPAPTAEETTSKAVECSESNDFTEEIEIPFTDPTRDVNVTIDAHYLNGDHLHKSLTVRLEDESSPLLTLASGRGFSFVSSTDYDKTRSNFWVYQGLGATSARLVNGGSFGAMGSVDELVAADEGYLIALASSPSRIHVIALHDLNTPADDSIVDTIEIPECDRCTGTALTWDPALRVVYAAIQGSKTAKYAGKLYAFDLGSLADPVDDLALGIHAYYGPDHTGTAVNLAGGTIHSIAVIAGLDALALSFVSNSELTELGAYPIWAKQSSGVMIINRQGTKSLTDDTLISHYYDGTLTGFGSWRHYDLQYDAHSGTLFLGNNWGGPRNNFAIDLKETLDPSDDTLVHVQLGNANGVPEIKEVVGVYYDSQTKFLYLSSNWPENRLFIIDTKGTPDASDDELVALYGPNSSPALPDYFFQFNVDIRNDRILVPSFGKLHVIDRKGTLDQSDDTLRSFATPTSITSKPVLVGDHLVYNVGSRQGISVVDLQQSEFGISAELPVLPQDSGKKISLRGQFGGTENIRFEQRVVPLPIGTTFDFASGQTSTSSDLYNWGNFAAPQQDIRSVTYDFTSASSNYYYSWIYGLPQLECTADQSVVLTRARLSGEPELGQSAALWTFVDDWWWGSLGDALTANTITSAFVSYLPFSSLGLYFYRYTDNWPGQSLIHIENVTIQPQPDAIDSHYSSSPDRGFNAEIPSDLPAGHTIQYRFSVNHADETETKVRGIYSAREL